MPPKDEGIQWLNDECYTPEGLELVKAIFKTYIWDEQEDKLVEDIRFQIIKVDL